VVAPIAVGAPPAGSAMAVARSFWRCYLDWKKYGTGR